MTRVHRITRRRALKVAAGAVGATLPLVHVQTAAAAGKLTMGIWDHWVPAANPVLKGLVDEWAAKNKVEVAIEFISMETCARLFAGAVPLAICEGSVGTPPEQVTGEVSG